MVRHAVNEAVAVGCETAAACGVVDWVGDETGDAGGDVKCGADGFERGVVSLREW